MHYSLFISRSRNYNLREIQYPCEWEKFSFYMYVYDICMYIPIRNPKRNTERNTESEKGMKETLIMFSQPASTLIGEKPIAREGRCIFGCLPGRCREKERKIEGKREKNSILEAIGFRDRQWGATDQRARAVYALPVRLSSFSLSRSLIISIQMPRVYRYWLPCVCSCRRRHRRRCGYCFALSGQLAI